MKNNLFLETLSRNNTYYEYQYDGVFWPQVQMYVMYEKGRTDVPLNVPSTMYKVTNNKNSTLLDIFLLMAPVAVSRLNQSFKSIRRVRGLLFTSLPSAERICSGYLTATAYYLSRNV